MSGPHARGASQIGNSQPVRRVIIERILRAIKTSQEFASVLGRAPAAKKRGEQVMDICGFLSRWFAEEWYWSAVPNRTEHALSRELKSNNVIYIDFKAVHEAKEETCGRK
ncbi:hypothetical protein CK489_12930 [Bradyrhizobium sp. UFLA03-84]|nr:hypothetical protein CK489_12930 [Bradyrhizobium sp. UFLA03-84]